MWLYVYVGVQEPKRTKEESNLLRARVVSVCELPNWVYKCELSVSGKDPVPFNIRQSCQTHATLLSRVCSVIKCTCIFSYQNPLWNPNISVWRHYVNISYITWHKDCVRGCVCVCLDVCWCMCVLIFLLCP